MSTAKNVARGGLLGALALSLACSAPAAPPATDATGPDPTPTTSTATTQPPPPPSTTTTTVLDAEQVMEIADPQRLAVVLVEAERTVRDPSTPPEELARWGRIQQNAYRLLGARSEWQPLVRELLAEELRFAYDAHLRAAGSLSDLTRPQEELPDWTILTPRPPEELLGYYREAEERYGVGWEYLAAIHFVETRMGRIRGNSPAGARGPMQFIPSTWEAYGEGDIDDDHDAILAAARYLAARGAPEDMARALYAYNPSDHYVTAVEAYASVMREDPRAYYGYYHWQVYYRLGDEVIHLPEGWEGG